VGYQETNVLQNRGPFDLLQNRGPFDLLQNKLQKPPFDLLPKEGASGGTLVPWNREVLQISFRILYPPKMLKKLTSFFFYT